MSNQQLESLVERHFNTKTPLTWSECKEVEETTGNRELVERHFNTKEPLTFSECKTLVELV
jgi:hypothetical protein